MFRKASSPIVHAKEPATRLFNPRLNLLDGKGSDSTALDIGRSTKSADRISMIFDSMIISPAIIDKPLLFVLTLLVTQTFLTDVVNKVALQ